MDADTDTSTDTDTTADKGTDKDLNPDTDANVELSVQPDPPGCRFDQVMDFLEPCAREAVGARPDAEFDSIVKLF